MRNTRDRAVPMMEFVNDVIDDLHRSLELADSDFFCECGSVACSKRITLTRAEYADLREAERPVLCAQHAGTAVHAVPAAWAEW